MIVTIIGIGSPFGDDALGWLVLKQLQKMLASEAISNSLQFELLDRPGPSLLNYFKQSDNLICVDAIYSDHTPGTLHFISNSELHELPKGISSHGFGLSETIQLAKALDYLPQVFYLYGIEMNPDLRQTGLSPAVLQAIPILAQRICADLKNLIYFNSSF